MPRFFVLLATLLLLGLTADQAPAWNSIGHMAVAKLAYDQLEAKQQLALYKLLKGHPHYTAYLAAGRPAEIDNEVEWVVMRCAVWPDWIRPRRNDKRTDNVSKYHRGEEHYVNIPFVDPKDEKFFAGKTLVSPDLPNIVSALKHRANDLKTKSAAIEDRAVAACWLFHLVGDIHQPLHNVAYFSSDKAFIEGDMGGNKIAIRVDGRKYRLHAFWDDLLGEDRDYADESPAHQAAIYREAFKVAARLRDFELSEADKEALTKHLTFESWSREGFDLAKTVGYRKADGSFIKLTPTAAGGALADEAEEVGAEYIKTARAVADRRVVLAGKRLADRLRVLLQ
jgi:hypothetical protein